MNIAIILDTEYWDMVFAHWDASNHLPNVNENDDGFLGGPVYDALGDYVL